MMRRCGRYDRYRQFGSTEVTRVPLQSPYQGPFKVTGRQGKFYKLDLGTRHDSVSIDRLKPASLEEATHAIEPPCPAGSAEVWSPTRTTHSGFANREVVCSAHFCHLNHITAHQFCQFISTAFVNLTSFVNFCHPSAHQFCQKYQPLMSLKTRAPLLSTVIL